MDTFNLKRFLVENKITKNSILLNENQTSQESYIYDEPSLLDFVKKNIGDIEMEITGHFHDTYPPVYSSDDVYEVEDIVFIKGKKYGPPVAIINRMPTQKDLELTGTDRNDWREGFNRELIPGKDPKYITSYRRKNRYMHAYIKKKPPLKNTSNISQSKDIYNNPYFGNTTTTFDKLKENKMQDFDLKRFLVENKMTRNSRLLNEDLTYDTLPAEVKQRYENNGRIGVAFVKKDGSVRHMSFSKTLKAYQPSATAKTDAQANYRQNNNLWSGYDVNAYIKAKRETGDDAAAAKQSFRNFKLENVLAFSAGGKVFDMRDENNIVERFGEDVANALTKTMIQSLERDSAATEPTSDEPQLDEYGFDFDGMGSSNNSQSVKASFEGKWNPVPKANKDVLDKSTGKDTQLVGVFGQSNYAIAKGSDGKFYRYEYRQASTPGTPKGPFDTIEKAKEGIK